MDVGGVGAAVLVGAGEGLVGVGGDCGEVEVVGMVVWSSRCLPVFQPVQLLIGWRIWISDKVQNPRSEFWWRWLTLKAAKNRIAVDRFPNGWAVANFAGNCWRKIFGNGNFGFSIFRNENF